MKKIAIPSEAPGGLDALVCPHFGRAPMYTLISVNDGEIGEVTVMENLAHGRGACRGPVDFLVSMGVSDVLAGGLGQGPYAALEQAGVSVYRAPASSSLRESMESFIKGELPPFDPAAGCGHCAH